MSVYIFVPAKKAFLKRWHMLLVVLIFSLLLILLDNLNFEWKKTFIEVLRVLAIFFLLAYFIIWFYSFREKEKLNGFLSGQLIFKYDEIAIENKIYNISEILKITIQCEDYEGMFMSVLTNTPHPKYSSGINNFLEIKFKNGDKKTIQFKQNYEKEIIKKNKEKLISFYRQGIISFLYLIELLGIEDYNEIQDFKKTLEILHPK